MTNWGCAVYYVYLLTNQSDTVMYIGVTNDLKRRLLEHRSGLIEGFTKKYHVHKLVYYETFSDINNAIRREKQLKGWIRAKKNALVETMNPKWLDLSVISDEE
ncbi:MAG: GIY-YIG nuclease family protein [Ruminococcaceae bacterium]|nr:GIY-YIG nuclease family protein [Oscillospiraceae bacterium]